MNWSGRESMIPFMVPEPALNISSGIFRDFLQTVESSFKLEAMDTILAATKDLWQILINHPFYIFTGSLFICILLLKVYLKLSIGMCNSNEDMAGKTVLITGAASGIGKATAFDLARRNARLILACRNLDKGRQVSDEIISVTDNTNVIVKYLDLASFDSVRECAQEVIKTQDKLHVLINNAGMFSDLRADKMKFTVNHQEEAMQVNYFSHFLLTLLLLDLLKRSAPGRIINISSTVYKIGTLDLNDLYRKARYITSLDLYVRSKLAIILFTRELASRLQGSDVTVNALHPGASPEEGAQTAIYLAVHPDLQGTTGKIFVDCKEAELTGQAKNQALAKELFKFSENIVGTTFD